MMLIIIKVCIDKLDRTTEIQFYESLPSLKRDPLPFDLVEDTWEPSNVIPEFRLSKSNRSLRVIKRVTR